MGSQQSTSISPPHPTTTTDETNTGAPLTNIDTDLNNKPKRKKKTPPNLHGFKLIEYKCRKKRRAYDLCSSTKHKSFVAGRKLEDEDGDEQSCDDLFDIYKECIYKGMMADREKRGLKIPTDESALGGFVEDADE
jgi:hypothetical protein